MGHIHIEEKRHSLAEVIGLVSQTLKNVGEVAKKEDFTYTSEDTYWLLHDMIRYINQNISGELNLKQIRKNVYKVEYTSEDAANQDAKRSMRDEIAATADYLEEITGQRPVWGAKNEGQ